MNIKKIFLAIFVAWIFGISVVYSNFVKISEIKVAWILSKNIVTDSINLNKTIIAFKSPIDISWNEIKWVCKTKTNYLYKKEDLYFFQLEFLDKNCFNWNYYLKNYNWDLILNTHFELNLVNNFNIYNNFVDHSDNSLKMLEEYYLNNLEKNYLFKKLTTLDTNLNFIKNNRTYLESEFYSNIISNILQNRKTKYVLPVKGYDLSHRHTKLPNSPRPYRASYTDWVHNWWDIDAPYWTPVISIDNWIIVKIVNWFKFSDLDKINYSKNLTQDQKRVNLDILRWNQVWIKTMKWDVIFYAHLSELDGNLKVGDFVSKSQYLWKIWITWVPDKDYSDYHLHFELKKNPRDANKNWKYTLMDYMRWDWYFKWKDDKYILENQYNIFQKN